MEGSVYVYTVGFEIIDTLEKYEQKYDCIKMYSNTELYCMHSIVMWTIGWDLDTASIASNAHHSFAYSQ
jgi:hypothetical protein